MCGLKPRTELLSGYRGDLILITWRQTHILQMGSQRLCHSEVWPFHFPFFFFFYAKVNGKPHQMCAVLHSFRPQRTGLSPEMKPQSAWSWRWTAEMWNYAAELVWVSGLVTVGMFGIQAAALIKVDTLMTSEDSYVTVTPVNTPDTPPGLSTPRNVTKKKGDKDHGRTWRTCRGVCWSRWCLPPSPAPSPVYYTAEEEEEEEEGRSTYWEQLHSNFLWCRIRIIFLL